MEPSWFHPCNPKPPGVVRSRKFPRHLGFPSSRESIQGLKSTMSNAVVAYPAARRDLLKLPFPAKTSIASDTWTAISERAFGYFNLRIYMFLVWIYITKQITEICSSHWFHNMLTSLMTDSFPDIPTEPHRKVTPLWRPARRWLGTAPEDQ